MPVYIFVQDTGWQPLYKKKIYNSDSWITINQHNLYYTSNNHSDRIGSPVHAVKDSSQQQIFSSAILNRQLDGWQLDIYNKGLLSGCTCTGGTLNIQYGGLATSNYIAEGPETSSTCYLRVYNGGIAEYTTINSRGQLFVSSGGTAEYTIINSKGNMQILSSANASNITVNTAGELYVSGTGNASFIIQNGGYVSAADNAVVTFTSNVFSGVSLGQYQSATVHSGTTAVSTTLDRFSTLDVYGGTLVDTTLNSGASYSIQKGINAVGFTVNSGASLKISSGGTITNITVSEGGLLTIPVVSDTYVQGTNSGSNFEMSNAILSYNYQIALISNSRT